MAWIDPDAAARVPGCCGPGILPGQLARSGPGHEDRAFPAQRLGPTRIAIDQGRWLINGQFTFPGRPAEGLLINVRMVNSAFEDDRPKNEWPAILPQDFDPEANSDAFIASVAQLSC